MTYVGIGLMPLVLRPNVKAPERNISASQGLLTLGPPVLLSVLPMWALVREIAPGLVESGGSRRAARYAT